MKFPKIDYRLISEYNRIHQSQPSPRGKVKLLNGPIKATLSTPLKFKAHTLVYHLPYGQCRIKGRQYRYQSIYILRKILKLYYYQSVSSRGQSWTESGSFTKHFERGSHTLMRMAQRNASHSPCRHKVIHTWQDQPDISPKCHVGLAYTSLQSSCSYV